MKKLPLKTNLYLLIVFYLPATATLGYATTLDYYFAGFIWLIGGIVIHKMELDDPLICYLIDKYI